MSTSSAPGMPPDGGIPGASVRVDVGGQVRLAGRRLMRHCARGAAPFAVMAGLHMTAHSLHVGQASPLAGAAAPVVAAGVGLLLSRAARRWLLDPGQIWRRVWAAGCLVAAAGWGAAGVAGGVGMTTLMPSLLVAGGSLLAAPWWARRDLADAGGGPPRGDDVGDPTTLASDTPASQTEGEKPHPHELIWETQVATLERWRGTVLQDPQPLTDPSGQPNGTAWIINGQGGRVPWTRMFANLGDLYLAFDGPNVDRLVHLERDGQQYEARARLVVLERDPFAHAVQWRGPRLDAGTGVVPFAVYADGSGWAPYRLFVPGWGTAPDLILGFTGMGKGVALRLIAIESLVFGSRVLLMDPQRTGALGDVTGLVRTPLATPQEIIAGWCGVDAVLDERVRIRAQVGAGRFGPAFGHPILHVLCDEFAEVSAMHPVVGQVAARAARQGRKVYVKSTVASQDTGFALRLGEDGAAILDQAQSGNTIVYRVSPTAARHGGLGQELPVAPHQLPLWLDEDQQVMATGVGYVLPGRAMISRTQVVSDAMFAAWCPPVARQRLDDRSEEAYWRGYNEAMSRMDGSESLTPRHDPGEPGGPAGPGEGGVDAPAGAGQGQEGSVTALRDLDADRQATERLLEFLADGPKTRAQISDAGLGRASRMRAVIAQAIGDRLIVEVDGAYRRVAS